MKKIAILFKFLGLALICNAQISLIETGAKQISEFPEYASLFTEYLNSSEYESIEIATICNLESCASETDSYYIEVDGQVATWMPSIVEHNSNSTYFGGMLNGDIGNLSLLFTTSGISGKLNIGGNSYSINKLEHNDVLLAKYIDELPPFTCGMVEGEGTSTELELECIGYPDLCQAVITVLCLANQEALDWLDNKGWTFEDFAKSAQGRMNEILYNSGIQNKRFYMVVHPTATGITDNIDINGGIHYSTAMQNLQDEYSADILFHYCKLIPGSSDGQAYCNGAVTATSPYALSEISRDFHLEINMPHEIGHLFNISHQAGEGQCGLSCHDAWDIFSQISNATERRVTSVWTGLGSASEYSRRYSNPYVNYQGFPAGVLNQHYSAKRLSNEFCNVADNNPTLDFMVDIIATPNYGEDPECPISYTLQSSINVPGPGLPGQPSYEFEWRSSVKPIFSSTQPGTFESSDPSFVFENPGGVNPGRYIQLKVTGSDGFSLTAVKWLYFCEIGVIYGGFRKIEFEEEISIAPNPVFGNDLSQVRIFYPEQTKKITIVSISGEAIYYQKILAKTSSLNLPSNLILPKGVYIVLASNEAGEVIDNELMVNQ